MNITCKDCRLPMHGPLFEPKHSDPNRLVVVHAPPRGLPPEMAVASCYYECPKCKSRVVFDPLWSECTGGERRG